MKVVKEILENELKTVRDLKVTVTKSLKNVPEGSLVISKSNGVTQFFHKTDKNSKKGNYINKKDTILIRRLAQKDYDLKLYEILEKREKRLEKALRLIPDEEITGLYKKLTEVRKNFVDSHMISDEEYVKAWLDVNYEGNHFHEENKKFITERGELVRSKSEKIIADKLFLLGIPYRYEYPIKVKGKGTIYPDFTILMMPSRREVYLEHFGMMDVPEYCENALCRIQELSHHGIVLGKNLFTTFESSTVPLDVKVLDLFQDWQR